MSAKHTVKVNLYKIISEAVESGVAYGYRRAHKYTDTPGEDLICQQIEDAVLNELCEVLVFDT